MPLEPRNVPLEHCAANLALIVALNDEYSDIRVDVPVSLYLAAHDVREPGPQMTRMRQEIANAFIGKIQSLTRVESPELVDLIRRRILREV
jgi:hypothetical protein